MSKYFKAFNFFKGKVSPTIKSVKPSVGKTKLQKELSDIKKQGRKSIGKIKKDHMKNMAPLDKAHSSLRQNIQRLKGEPVTKSGLSKGKDLRDKNKKMGGGMIGRRMGYSQGKLAVTPREKQLAAQYGDKKRITRGDVITAAKSKSGKRMQASVGGGAGQTSREKILFQLNKNIKNVKEKMGGRKITRSQEDKLRDIIKKRKKP